MAAIRPVRRDFTAKRAHEYRDRGVRVALTIVALVAVLVGCIGCGGDDDKPATTSRRHLVPARVPRSLKSPEVVDTPVPAAPASMVVYGDPAGGGPALAVIVLGGPNIRRSLLMFGASDLPAEPQEVSAYPLNRGLRAVRWTEKGRLIVVLGRGLDDTDLLRAAAQALVDSEGTITNVDPPGDLERTLGPSDLVMFALGVGAPPENSVDVLSYVGRHDVLRVYVFPAGNDYLAQVRFLFSGYRDTTVRGQRALIRTRDDTFVTVTWREPDGRAVYVTTDSLNEQDVRDVAASMRPVSEVEWRALRRTSDN
jgi:hypothetical protein